MLLGFVQKYFAPPAHPIGVDFGTDGLRMAQVQFANNEHKLAAAASADVPAHLRNDPQGRLKFFTETTRELLAQGNFKGRQAILALPAAVMHIQHLRMPRMDEAETKKALPFEARGKLPIDPSQALLRHLIAGEVYQEQDPRNEVIVMAAAREWVNAFLVAAAKAKLDVVGMNVEPQALIDCFGHVYRRKSDAELTSCYIDIGSCGTRAVIARGRQILFARSIPIGGDHLIAAVAKEMNIAIDDAKLLRIKLCAANPTLDDHREETSFALLNAGLRQSAERQDGESEADVAQRVERACAADVSRLAAELDLCRRYYESTFPNKPVERLIFVGGEARQRTLCQSIARELGVAAQLGDPLVRMARVSEIGIESGIDRRQPQPGWAVAIGLSLGPSVPESSPNTASAAATSSSASRTINTRQPQPTGV